MLVFAFGLDHAVVDVNVARVLARAVAGAPVTAGGAQDLADALVPRGRAWAWNQALMELGAVVCVGGVPACEACPLARRCAWRSAGEGTEDPTRVRTRQARFEGSDRQGRGRLVDALRHGPVRRGALATACGWPGDPDRARRVAAGLVAEGLARRGPGGVLHLP